MHGEKPEGGRPLKNSAQHAEFWTQDKTALDLGISSTAVRKAIKIALAIEQYPQLAAEKVGSVVLRKAAELQKLTKIL